MKRLILALLTVTAALVRADTPSLPDGLYARITVPEGTIVCQLDYKVVPLPVVNFVGLAEGTLGPKPRKPFFNGLQFHRVVPGFVIQGGDPLNTGEGGPGYAFPDQFSADLRHDKAGILSMANDGPDTNGSQFFITLANTDRLDFLHSVFGSTVQGLDVLPKVKQGDTMTVEILRLGAEAKAFKADDEAFEAAKKAAHPYTASMDIGPKADFDDPSRLLPEDPPRAKNFNYKLGNVERTTGVKIRVRMVAAFTPSGDVASAGAQTKLLAQQLGTDKDAVLAVYYANLDFWDFWFADSCVGTFIGKPGANPGQLEPGDLRRAKYAFLDQAHAQAKRYLEEALAALPKDKPMTPQMRLKYQVDGVVDGLIDRMNGH